MIDPRNLKEKPGEEYAVLLNTGEGFIDRLIKVESDGDEVFLLFEERGRVDARTILRMQRRSREGDDK